MSFKNYHYVKSYLNNIVSDNEIISKNVDKQIKKSLHTAWLQTPSKNNFMPYKVHILGPQFVKEKQEIYWLCLGQETKADGFKITSRSDLLKYDKKKSPRAFGTSELGNNDSQHGRSDYRNILSAPYVLIFTQRVEDTLNEVQKWKISKGRVFEQMATHGDKKSSAKISALLEIGMFSTNFASECLAANIDISHTLCFPTNRKDWPQEYFAFLDENPLLIMTAGMGENYRSTKEQTGDQKPDFDRIVNIISKDD